MELKISPEDVQAATQPLLKAVASQLAGQIVTTATELATDALAGNMDKAGAATYLGQEVRTIENWMRPVAEGGRGLPHFKIGATVLFSRKRIDAWLLTMERNAPPMLRPLEAVA